MEGGRVTSDHAEINDTFKGYYSQLYTSEFSNNTILMHNFLSQINIPMLSPKGKMRLDKPITKEEIDAAISSLQSGKYPGPDLSSLLSSQLSTVLSDSFKQSKLPYCKERQRSDGVFCI